jgi:hypothetical protein
LAQDARIGQPLVNFSVVSEPLLNYTYVGFQGTQNIMDIWNDSFEDPLTSTNHYWYGSGYNLAEGMIKRNNTLESGFEEISSSNLNPNVSLPSWFIHLDKTDLTVEAARSSTRKYLQSYSAYVETRFTNTSSSLGYLWQTPYSVYDTCGGDPTNTMDDNLATDWSDSTTERHWVIYDLNQNYFISNVRVYGGSEQINDVDIYVSDDAQSLY